MTKPYRKMSAKVIREVAAGYETRSAMKAGDLYVYRMMHTMEIADQCCSHMRDDSIKRRWTAETLQVEANKYATRRQFAEQNRPAYSAAVRLRLLNDICKHMPRNYDRRIVIAKPPGKSRYELLYAPPEPLSDMGNPVVAGNDQIGVVAA